jgi:hypothetical protein
MKYVYNLALRRADHEKKQYIIEHDMITTESLIDSIFAKEISDKYQCDVRIQYIGQLQESQEDTYIDSNYHTEEMIQNTLQEWQEKQREEFNSGTN